MRFCSKCGNFDADQWLAFCPDDGTPLTDVDPSSNAWDQATRFIEQKQNSLKTQQRRLKWRRVMLRAMLMATMVVSVAAVSRSISVTVDRPQGKLCIATFNDLNGDGVQDASEPDLSGFGFQVSGTGTAATLTTGPNGVGCAVLPVGTYTVVEQTLSGLIATTPTTQTVTVTAGQAAKLFFGSRQETELCIRKFDDLNGNGVQDAGEAGLSGFVFLVSRTGAAATLTTGPNGVVCAVMPVGPYTVVEHPQPGWIATTPTRQTVTVTAHQAANVLFGSRQESGELGIQDFNDLNGNGVREPKEPGLSGFVFQVGGTDPAKTLTTGPNGVSSAVLPVGTYTVVEQPQNGWTTTTRTTQTVTVTAGQTANLFFGNRQARGQLGIQEFNDLNGNGVREPDEPGLSGFVFQVRGTDTVTTLTTSPNGVSSAVLAVGTYTVVEQSQAGWTATTPTTQTVTVAADQPANMLFGSRKERGKLCLRTFDDQNGNRVQDPGEADLSGIVFQVRGAGAATTLTTDLNGGGCSDLPVGTYTVVETPKPGWIATTPTTQTVTVTAGRAANMLFGSRQERSKLCIRTFDDQNGNGAKEADEPGLSGFVFQVSGTDLATTLKTDPKGGICSELLVGTYTVVEQPQDGWIATTPTTQTVTVTLGRAANVLFGSRKERRKTESGKLCIRTFDDQNGNGAKEADEPDLSGFVFQVSRTDLATTLKTDLKGGICSELPVGKYTVVETPKPGWTATTKTTQTITVTANQATNLSFGNRANSVCTEADKNRERQIIINQYGGDWRKSIQGERDKIIAENVPHDSKLRYEISLGRINPQYDFRNCATVTVALRYVWLIDFFAAGKKTIPGGRKYFCEKTAGGWICSK